MKLRKIRIENFRQIAFWEHDFTDSLGRVRDATLIVGPNGSGKTSILDAIAAATNPVTHINALRPGLEMSLRRIVRRGATNARVWMEVEFAPVEVETALTVAKLLGWEVPASQVESISQSGLVTFDWQYPDPEGTEPAGRFHFTPADGWAIFHTRSRIARLLATQRFRQTELFETAGAVFTFDQQRSLFGRNIPRPIWELLAHTDSLPDVATSRADDSRAEADRRTADPRLLLLSLAIQELLPPGRRDAPGAKSDFARVRETYARVCAPYAIKGAVRDDVDRFDVEFVNGTATYDYADLSSGEQMVLLILIRLVTERVHRSILLVDELELHQHPIWQRRLLDSMQSIGIDNQIIATTHSDYLRDVMPPGSVVSLGSLGGKGGSS